MFSHALKSIASAFRQLISNWKHIPIVLLVYITLLAASYFFVGTREATIPQLVVSLALFTLVPILFFVLQAMSLSYAETTNSLELLRKSVVGFWKLALVSVPVVLLAILGWYGLNRLQARLGIGPLTSSNVQAPHNRLTLLTAARLALVGLISPLALIHLWIVTTKYGLRGFFKRLGAVVCDSFKSEAILIYALGSLVFLFAPYFILNKSITSERAWIEIGALTARLVISALLVLLGWVATVGALTFASRHAQLTSEWRWNEVSTVRD